MHNSFIKKGAFWNKFKCKGSDFFLIGKFFCKQSYFILPLGQ